MNFYILSLLTNNRNKKKDSDLTYPSNSYAIVIFAFRKLFYRRYQSVNN